MVGGQSEGTSEAPNLRPHRARRFSEQEISIRTAPQELGAL